MQLTAHFEVPRCFTSSLNLYKTQTRLEEQQLIVSCFQQNITDKSPKVSTVTGDQSDSAVVDFLAQCLSMSNKTDTASENKQACYLALTLRANP